VKDGGAGGGFGGEGTEVWCLLKILKNGPSS